MRGVRRIFGQTNAGLFLVFLACSLALVGCGNRDDSTGTERCDNQVDDNDNGLVDCEDRQCFAAPNCEVRQEHCYNLVDDDGDGDTDCADSDCDSTVVCLERAENCINNVDDDANGERDCDDGACENTATCLVGAENCTNEVDDDGDGDVDCDDPDCAETAVCVTRGEICDNGKDEDSDGDTDCDDSDCAGTAICLGDGGEVCTNGADDDDDGLIDCRDLDCAYTSACLGLGEDCGNGIDDDANGVADCQDDYCNGAPECVSPPEDCSDGTDNDGDGATDCEDDKCANTAFCVEFFEDCQDGEDDDGDGEVDCDDPDCEFTWICLGRIEDCENGADDDNDGDTDCEDVDCANTSFCVEPVEDCQNSTDDDGDGDADCDDSDCRFTSVCLTRGEDCGNGSDDDGDGDIDCADSDCANTSDCTTPLEDCSDGIDNDGDGDTDCDDANCESTSACLSQGEDCLDGIDNDGDGDTDCDDTDCANTSQCVAPVEDCDDGADNDGDGDVDCTDSDCQSTTVCLSRVEDCQNTVDDDGDGDVDCADADCANTALCVPAVEDCTNGSDDDGDGDVDCADADCEFTSVCVAAVEDCSNGSDDDGDGDADCADSDCSATSVCTPLVEDCSSGADDDGDGAIDCADSDCEFTSVCVASAEDCTNGTDDDGDGDADCVDTDCVNTTFCATPVEDCTNGADDDGDGDADCADADCTNTTFCATPVEDCTNGSDDDGDGDADCADADCTNTTFCATFAEDCTNGADDDGDGATDCADSDCEFTSYCVPVAEDCTNGSDDDGDGNADCADTDCQNTTFCVTPVEDCTNGTDDDGDGSADCADGDCEFTNVCLTNGESCTNGTDDDGDGATDCADTDCAGTSTCVEDCQDGVDNDGNGSVDCDDSACEFTELCVPKAEECTNGTDDDLDGDTDCADTDCASVPSCATYQLAVLPPPPSGQPTRTFYTSVNGQIGPVSIEVTDANTLAKLEGVPLTVTSPDGVVMEDTVVTNSMGIAPLDIRASLAPGQYTFTVTAPDGSTTADVVSQASTAPDGVSVPLVNVSGVSGDSTASEPGLDAPVGDVGGVAVDSAGVMYFADKDHHRIRRLSPAGVMDTLAGTGTSGYDGDGGAATSARLNAPSAVAYDGSRDWVVFADAGNGVLRYVDLSTGVIDTLTSPNSSSATAPLSVGTDASTVYVGDVNYLAADSSSGDIYVSGGATAGVMRIYDSSGTLTIRQFLMETSCVSTDALFLESCGTNGCPLDFSDDSSIGLVVAGQYCGTEIPGGSGNAIARRDPGSSPELVIAGNGLATALPASAAEYEFVQFQDIALDDADNLYVLEGNRVVRLDPATVRTVVEASASASGFNYDYVGFSAVRLSSPKSIEFDGSGSLLVAGGSMNLLTRLEGMGRAANDPVVLTPNTPSNGAPLLNQAVSPSVSLSDSMGNPVQRAWTSFSSGLGQGVADTAWVQTNGTGSATGTAWVSLSPGYYSFAAQAYDLYYRPTDTAEVFYNAAWPTNASLFTAVNVDGVSSIASKREPAVKAPLKDPRAVVVGNDGRVFFTEVGNNTVWEVLGDGTVLRIAGDGTAGNAKVGVEATSSPMNRPVDLYYDERNTYLYVAEFGSERILGIDLADGKSAVIERVAGETGQANKPTATFEDATKVGLGEVYSIDGIYRFGKFSQIPHIYVVGANTDGIAEIEIVNPTAPDASAMIRSYLPEVTDCTGGLALNVCGAKCRVSVTDEALYAFGTFCSETLGGPVSAIASYDEAAAQWRLEAGTATGVNDSSPIPYNQYEFKVGVGEIEATDSSIYGPAVFFTEPTLGVTRLVDIYDAEVHIAAGIYGSIGYSGDYRVPTNSTLAEPTGVFFDDARDRLWIADTANQRVRVASPSGVVPILR